MKILVVDTETTGLDPQKDSLLEIAAILWSTKHKCVLMQASTLINYSKVVENPAEPINGISSSALEEVCDYQLTLALIEKMAISAKYICAHNASFDKLFCAHLEGLKNICLKNWIDTQDITYPKSQYATSSSLSNLALIHGIPIVDSHRALNDCSVLVKLLSLVSNLDEELEKASRPKVLVKSLEEKPGILSKKMVSDGIL